MKEHFESLLQRDMSRKEFLRLIATGIAAIVGLLELSRVLTGKRYHGQSGVNYSAGTYGGGEPSRQ